MKLRVFILTFSVLFLFHVGFADFPVVDKGDIKPNDKRLGKPIGISKAGELTIASFNIRNLCTRGRSLKDFEALADLVNEADIVVLQEVGLGMFKGKGTQLTEADARRLDAFIALFQIFLGKDWVVIRSPFPTGVDNGREASVLAYRKHGQGFDIDAQWQQYEKISHEKRDMAVFKVTLTKGSQKKEIWLGSVHLTPEDPHRGSQMIEVAQWLLKQQDKQAIVMGDFNWGYKKNSKIPAEENYKGEDFVRRLHKEQKVFQLFAPLSYNGEGKGNQLRTNLGFRKSAYFYDQFLMTPGLAEKLADGGKLLQDCGIIAFGVHNKYMKKRIKDLQEDKQYGLNKFFKYLKAAGITQTAFNDSLKNSFEKTLADITSQGQNEATWVLSDHRVVWMQLKM